MPQNARPGRSGRAHPEAAVTDALELVAAALAGVASRVGLLPAPTPDPDQSMRASSRR